jgi:hypothetical protein
MGRKPHKMSKVTKTINTDIIDELKDRGIETTKEVVKSDKEVKLSKKSVDNVLSNLDGFSSEDVQKIQDVFKKLEDGGKVTNGQGGGTSYDTPEITKFRKDFGDSVESISDGHDVTKTGKKLYYVKDSNGKLRYPTLYLRSKEQLNKTKK